MKYDREIDSRGVPIPRSEQYAGVTQLLFGQMGTGESLVR